MSDYKQSRTDSTASRRTGINLVRPSADGLHPEEEKLEKYTFGTLRGKALARLEEHLIECASCRNRVNSIQEFTTAMRVAAVELTTIPLNFTHSTSDGPIHLYVKPAEGGGWIASIEAIQPFEAVEQANEFLSRLFSSAFPKHQCQHCGVGRPRQK